MKVKDAAMQAFPFIEPESDDAIKAYHPGMTIRDEFAKAAMQGIVSALHHGIRPADISAMCNDAYAIADEMLKARK